MHRYEQKNPQLKTHKDEECTTHRLKKGANNIYYVVKGYNNEIE